jgi:acyl-coenzyme A thioesterase PaaI-like protein
MDVLEIPFNKFVGLKKAEIGSGFILALEEREEYLNHLGTIHASALFALAEATSGAFLNQQFKDLKLNVVPLVRKVELKYSKPGNGNLYSKASFIDKTVKDVIVELDNKKRTCIHVRVDIFNEDSERLMNSVFECFITVFE